jgi:hypothetical protein
VWNNTNNAKNYTRKDIQIKLYKIIAAPMLAYGRDNRVMKRPERKKIQTADIHL